VEPSSLQARHRHAGVCVMAFFWWAWKSGAFTPSSATTDLVSRSQITMFLSVPAHNHYRLGENTSVWMTDCASSEYRCLPSVRSQSMAVPSRPPLAHSEPSGLIVTLFT